jgi:uncharacterized protein (DUF1330 family)
MNQICGHCNKEFEAPYHQKTICDECIFQNCVSCGTRFRTTTQQRRNPKWGKFCTKKCATRFEKKMRFKKNGYWCVKAENHPKAYERGYYYEHILVLEKKIGRYLKKGECVHHLDGDKLNNVSENLELHTRTTHGNYHWPEVSTSEDVGIDYRQYVGKMRNKVKRGWKLTQGYVRIWNPEHPMSRKDGYVPAHRIIMAEHIGRMLKTEEHVHHINGNRQDNRIENLELVHRKDHPSKHFRK